MRRSLTLALLLALVLSVPTAAAAGSARLLGRAVLPARTFAPGPPSGTLLGSGPINGVHVPFAHQPVQGISAALPAGRGRYWVMEDNGYGALENSADFNLRVYLVRPHFETARGGSGKVDVLRFIQLHDPDRKVPFAIVNNWTRRRVLTGADFDIESMQRARDGSLWFGDEFGPFLLHTTAGGRVLHAPYPLPDPDHPGQELRAPQNPFSEESSPVRVMNALRGDAQHHGDRNTPIVSPDSNLLVDNDPTTFEPTRENPPAGSGVPKASSEIFNVALLHNAGFKVVPYTVDSIDLMRKLVDLGVDGLISDRPDLLHQVVVEKHLDPSKFDAEGHRGGRDLRPENTLPAMEVGLDNLVTTLETDNHLTRDGVPILSHDPYIDTGKCRRTDGQPYTFADEILIRRLTLRQVQHRFVCDGVIRTGTPQTNDRSLSPVAVAFAKHEGLIDPYVDPTTQQLFDFVRFYVRYYRSGPGAGAPHATELWQNAQRVHFNIETKLNPRSDRDPHGIRYKDRTPNPQTITRTVAGVIERNHMQRRADVQSFDFRTLRDVHREFPNLLTVALFGDFPVFADTSIAGTDDGTNLQPQDGEANTRWLAGLYWPWRHTQLENPFRVQSSGGFEGMAQTPGRRTLVPILEKPLAGGPATQTQAFAFDLATRRYTGDRWFYPYDPRGISVPDFQLATRHRGITIERDNTQGDLGGFKALENVRLGAPGTTIAKTQAADLLHIADPAGISLPGQPGDVGLGDPFAMPFVTIEAVVILDRRHVLVTNDNNFPFSVGRHLGTATRPAAPDDNEFVVLRLPQPIR